jgi:cyclophilin family peptidyl-prolyl cis-trans isomerase
MVIDGYTAPVTAGCFIDLIQKGFYKGLPITRLVTLYYYICNTRDIVVVVCMQLLF